MNGFQAESPSFEGHSRYYFLLRECYLQWSTHLPMHGRETAHPTAQTRINLGLMEKERQSHMSDRARSQSDTCGVTEDSNPSQGAGMDLRKV